MRGWRGIIIVVGGLLALLTLQVKVQGGDNNGFDLSGVLIPAEQIYHGGPDKDGIPALDKPKFVTAAEADQWIKPSDRVLALELSGVAKAYPINILNWHEIVNDRIDQQLLVVTYCPLCGSGMAFSTQVDDHRLSFGVSGLLYNSDVLLYDRQTESLWSQLMRTAVAGPLKGSRLKLLPLEHTTWQHWKALHPDTLVLSTETGYSRNYRRDPYAGYETDKGLYFPVSRLDPRYHPKQRTLGLEIGESFKAYPFVELDKAGGRVDESFAGTNYLVIYDRDSQSARVEDGDGRRIPSVVTYWFAWMAFHPDSAVFTAP